MNLKRKYSDNQCRFFMLQTVKEDIFRNVGNSCTSLRFRIKHALVPGNRTLWLIRHYQSASCRLTKGIWSALCYFDKYSSGMQIPPQTKIGRGCRILHFGNIVVNPNATIGDNFNIAQGCLIGNSFSKSGNGVPVIGNNCCMFANSMVVGGVKIGNNVLIAPGAFVNFDVPDNSIVIGNPGKIIPRDSSPTAKYIVYPVENMRS